MVNLDFCNTGCIGTNAEVMGGAMPVLHPVPTDKAGEEQELHLAPLSTNRKASRVSNISSAAPWPLCPPCKEFLLCHLCQGLSARLVPGMVWARKVLQPLYFSSHEDNLEGCPSCLLCPYKIVQGVIRTCVDLSHTHAVCFGCPCLATGLKRC